VIPAARSTGAPDDDATGNDRSTAAHATPGAALDAANAALIEALPDAVWLVDADTLRVRAANAAAARLLGIDAHALCGRSVDELCATPEDLCFWSEVANGRDEQIVSDTRLRRADGSVLPVARSVRHVAQPGGTDCYVVCVHDRSTEVHAARRPAAALAGLRATLESTADGIWVTDLAGRTVACNRRFAALWGLDAELLERGDDAALREVVAFFEEAGLAVAGVAERDHPGRHRRRRATRRAAGGPLGVPRVAGGAKSLRLGEGGQAELRRVGLAKDDDPRRLEAAHQFAIVGPGDAAQRLRAVARRVAGDGGEQVLEQERHACERAIGQRSGGRPASRLIHAVDDGVEGRVEAVGAGDGRFKQLGRRHLPRAYQLGQAQRVVGVVVGEGGHMRATSTGASASIGPVLPAAKQNESIMPALSTSPASGLHVLGVAVV